jgi:hypothetical protein
VCLRSGTDWIFIYNSTFCPHSVFMCFMWIWEQTAIISLYSMCRLVFVMQTRCVYQEVETPTPVSAICITTTFCSAHCFLLHLLYRFTSVLLSLQPVDTHCPQLHCRSTLITNFPVSGHQPCGKKHCPIHGQSVTFWLMTPCTLVGG